MTSNFNFGNDGRRRQPGSQQVNLGEWMANQQRQFQEFDRSFGMPSAFGGFSTFSDPFSDPFFSHSPFHRRDPLSIQNQNFPLSINSQPSILMQSRDRGLDQKTRPLESEIPEAHFSPRSKVSFNEKFEIELCVEDFKPEDLYVKTEGNILSVSARQEGRGSCKEFEQRFTIPSGVNIEKLSSSLSKGGVLTISAPRSGLCLTNTGPDGQEPPSAIMDRASSAMTQPSLVYDDDRLTIEIDVKDYRPEDLDVKIDGQQLCVTASQDLGEGGSGRSRVFEQRFSLPEGVKPGEVQSSLTREGNLVITAPRDKSRADMDSGARHEQRELEKHLEQALSPHNWKDDGRRSTTHQTHESSNLPVSPFNFDNGVSRVDCDEDTYKIMVDVHQFRPEDLVIKTVDDSVIVEANNEEKTVDGRSYSAKSFSQSFNLPRGLDPRTVTSALSNEGVLTISAPLNKTLH